MAGPADGLTRKPPADGLAQILEYYKRFGIDPATGQGGQSLGMTFKDPTAALDNKDIFQAVTGMPFTGDEDWNKLTQQGLGATANLMTPAYLQPGYQGPQTGMGPVADAAAGLGQIFQGGSGAGSMGAPALGLSQLAGDLPYAGTAMGTMGGVKAARAAGNVAHNFVENPGRISQRLPTAVGNTEDVLGGKLLVDVPAFERSGAAYDKNVDLLRGYAGIGKVKGESLADTANRFMKMGKENLHYLHDAMPAPIRARAKLWYDGARSITDRWVKRYGVPDTGVAGTIAAMSPQKDWFQNVSLAERTLDIMHGQRGTRMTPEMVETSRRIFAKPEFKPFLQQIQGKTLDQVLKTGDDYLSAMWLRMYDEAHHSRSHRIVSPEGDFMDYARNNDGSESKVGWGSMGEIGKGISVIMDPRIENVAYRMGGKHKVRNFYNNILSPNSAHGDYTSDTHNVAATLFRPLSGSDTEVAHSFNNYAGKGVPGSGASAHTGIEGTYPLYADIGRNAAKERGLKPREMQSITWESVRGLFSDTFKSNKNNVAAVNKIWQDVQKGRMSPDEARTEVVRLAGGFTPPSWVGGHSGGIHGKKPNSTYKK